MITKEQLFIAIFKTILIMNAITCITNKIENKWFSGVVIIMGILNIVIFCIINEVQFEKKESKECTCLVPQLPVGFTRMKSEEVRCVKCNRRVR